MTLYPPQGGNCMARMSGSAVAEAMADEGGADPPASGQHDFFLTKKGLENTPRPL